MSVASVYLRVRAENLALLAQVYEAQAANTGNDPIETEAYNEAVLRLSDAVDALQSGAERIEERDGMRLPLHGGARVKESVA